MEAAVVAMVGSAAVPAVTTATAVGGMAFMSTVTPAVAATTGLLGSAGAITATGLMTGASSLFSMASAIGSGRAEEQALRSDAEYMEYQAKNEEIKGREDAAKIRMDLARSMATARARGGAGSIDISTGSPQDVAKGAAREAGEAIEGTRIGAGLKAGGKRAQARMTRDDARTARRTGYMKAGASILDLATDRAQAGAFA